MGLSGQTSAPVYELLRPQDSSGSWSAFRNVGRDETSGPVFVMGLALQDRQREECLHSPGMITASEGVTETVPLVITSQASDPRGRDGEACTRYL